jgi:hypothetical protein
MPDLGAPTRARSSRAAPIDHVPFADARVCEQTLSPRSSLTGWVLAGSGSLVRQEEAKPRVGGLK